MSPRQKERFWSKVDRRPGRCWVWTGAISSHGYGAVKVDGKVQRAHRVAWEMTNGPIPDGYVILHRCDNTSCVRPAHLSIGTQGENLKDMWAKGRAGGIAARFAAQTHCYRGHGFTPENTYHSTTGRRVCRACRRINRYNRKAATS